MICERCDVETFFAYGRIELGKKIIVCYKCAKEMDKEEQIVRYDKEDGFPVVLMEITRSNISAAISMFEEDEVEELAKIVWDTVLVGKLVDTIRETLVPYFNEGSLLRMAIKKVVEDEVAEIDEKHKFRSGLRRFLIYKKIGRI